MTADQTAGRDAKGDIRLNEGRGALVANATNTRADVQGWFDRSQPGRFRDQYAAALALFDREAAATEGAPDAAGDTNPQMPTRHEGMPMSETTPTRDDLIHAAATARFTDAYTSYPHDHPLTRSMREEAAPFVDGVLNALFPDTEGAPDPTSDMLIKAMGANPEGGIDLTLAAGGPNSEGVLLAIADACSDMLDKHNAENYVEFGVTKRGREAMLVTVRPAHRPSPHQLRRQAEDKLDAILAAIASPDGAEPDHAHDPAEYSPACGACVLAAVRAAAGVAQAGAPRG